MDASFSDIAAADVAAAKAFLSQFEPTQWRETTYAHMLESTMRHLGYTCHGSSAPAPAPQSPDTLDLEPDLPAVRRSTQPRAWVFHHSERGDWTLCEHAAYRPVGPDSPEGDSAAMVTIVTLPSMLEDPTLCVRASDLEGLLLRLIHTEHLAAKPHIISAVHYLASTSDHSAESVDLLGGLLNTRQSLTETLQLRPLGWRDPLPDTELHAHTSTTLDLYHRTSESSADAIHAGASWASVEQSDEVGFSTHPDGPGCGTGPAVVRVRIPREWLDSFWVRRESETRVNGGGVASCYAMKVDMLTGDLVVRPTGPQT